MAATLADVLLRVEMQTELDALNAEVGTIVDNERLATETDIRKVRTELATAVQQLNDELLQSYAATDTLERQLRETSAMLPALRETSDHLSTLHSDVVTLSEHVAHLEEQRNAAHDDEVAAVLEDILAHVQLDAIEDSLYSTVEHQNDIAESVAERMDELRVHLHTGVETKIAACEPIWPAVADASRRGRGPAAADAAT